MKKPSIRRNIVILHGWKVQREKYLELSSILTSYGYTVYIPDLPGFGENKGSKKILDMDNYSAFLEDYLKTNKLKNCVLIGHSHGSRVLVYFLLKHPYAQRNFGITGIILSGAPLIKQKFTLRKHIGVLLSKSGKKVVEVFPFVSDKNIETFRKIIYKIVGEWDYFNAGEMRQTFINVIKTDLQDDLSDIHIPTLLLWGKEDNVTLYRDALEIKKRISSSILVGVDKATHKLPYEYPNLCAKEVIRFIESL